MVDLRTKLAERLTFRTPEPPRTAAGEPSGQPTSAAPHPGSPAGPASLYLRAGPAGEVRPGSDSPDSTGTLGRSPDSDRGAAWIAGQILRLDPDFDPSPYPDVVAFAGAYADRVEYVERAARWLGDAENRAGVRNITAWLRRAITRPLPPSAPALSPTSLVRRVGDEPRALRLPLDGYTRAQREGAMSLVFWDYKLRCGRILRQHRLTADLGPRAADSLVAAVAMQMHRRGLPPVELPGLIERARDRAPGQDLTGRALVAFLRSLPMGAPSQPRIAGDDSHQPERTDG